MDTTAPAPFLESWLAASRQLAAAQMFSPANAAGTVDRLEGILNCIDARLALLEQRLDQAGVPGAAECDDEEAETYFRLPSLREEPAP